MEKPDSVSHYEELLQSGESMYFDPVELDDIFHYYVETADFDKVESVLALAKRLHPDDTTVMRMDTEYEANSGDPAKALEKLDRFFDAEVPFHCILRSAIFAKMQNKAEALDWAARAIEDVPPSDYVAYDLAIGFMNGMMYDEAIHYFRRSLKDHPDDVRTKTGLLYCLTQIGQLNDANTLAETLLEQDPFCIEAWVAKGTYLRAKGEYREAVDAYEYALAVAPDDSELLVMKATCLSELGEKQEALSSLEEYIQHREGPVHPSIYYFLGDLYFAQGKKDQSIEAIWGAFEAEDRTPEAYIHLGHAFAAMGDIRTAAVMFEAAYRPEEPDVLLLFDMGECYTSLDRAEDAIKCYKKICEIHPESNAYALWGGCLMSMSRFQAAYQVLKKAVDMEPLWQTYILMTVCDMELRHNRKMEEDFTLAYILCPDKSRDLLEKICPNEIERLEQAGLFAKAEERYLAYRTDKEDKTHLLADLRNALDEILPDDGSPSNESPSNESTDETTH